MKLQMGEIALFFIQDRTLLIVLFILLIILFIMLQFDESRRHSYF